MDSLGDRIKAYERAFDYKLPPNQPVIIRVDGRSFHTFLRGVDKPFDEPFIDCMRYAMRMVAGDMSGFKLAYHQSDEVTFLITDYDTHTTEGWFGYELNKLLSITASEFGGYFNKAYDACTTGRTNQFSRPAVFDARAFVVPQDDAPNVFIWRQRDWERNSLQMLARSHFSHKDLKNKNRGDMHEMLHSVGVNWADLTSYLKNGTFYTQDHQEIHDRLTYDEINALITWTKEADGIGEDDLLESRSSDSRPEDIRS
jgi:tRNA(His) 5'-end guanylyltransferase